MNILEQLHMDFVNSSRYDEAAKLTGLDQRLYDLTEPCSQKIGDAFAKLAVDYECFGFQCGFAYAARLLAECGFKTPSEVQP